MDVKKGTYMAAMVAPTKRAPKVFPRDGIAGDCWEDIAGYKGATEGTLGLSSL